jgi:O-antigen/teichoic acid export membrane protein
MLGMLEITTQILSTLFGVSLYHAFLRWYWDKQFVDKQKSIFFTLLIFILITGVAFNLILIPFHKGISFLLLDSDQYTYLITLIILISGLEALALIISTLIRLQDKPGKYTFLLISKFTISLLFTIYFIAYKGKKIDGIYEAQLIGNAVFFLLVAGYVRKNISFKLEIKILGKMLQFCYPLLFTAIAGIIFTITDRYVLRFTTDLSYVGIYSLGYKIANTLKVFIIASIHLALQPIIYKMMDDPEHKRFYSKVMTYFTFGVMIFALGLSLFGKEMIKFLAQKNPDYWEAFNIVPLIILGLIFGMLKDVSTIGINITKRTRIYAWTIIIVSITNLGLNLIFIPVYGYMGAAAATVISQMAYFIILYSVAQKFYHIPY